MRANFNVNMITSAFLSCPVLRLFSRAGIHFNEKGRHNSCFNFRPIELNPENAMVPRRPGSMESLISFDIVFTFFMILLLQAVLGFDNLLYISIESRRVREDKELICAKIEQAAPAVLSSESGAEPAEDSGQS